MDIGGYFGFEGFPTGPGLAPSGGHAFATGRQALIHWLTARGVRRLHLPGWSCPAVPAAADAAGVETVCHPLGEDLLYVDPPVPGADEAVLLLNAFGLLDDALDALDLPAAAVIVDDTMAFFRGARGEQASFNSWRKFLPVPDGATLWAPGLPGPPERRAAPGDDAFLCRRAEEGAEAAYAEFRRHEEAVGGWPASRPSSPAVDLVGRLDAGIIRSRRRENFAVLHDALGADNSLAVVPPGPGVVPLAYPFLPERGGVHESLWAQKIWVPRLWGSDDRLQQSAWERRLANDLLPLPIDHRYGPAEMAEVAAAVSGL